MLAQIVGFASNTNSSLQHVIAELLMEGGVMAREFWIGVIGIGFVVPICVALALVMPKLIFSREYKAPRTVEAIVPVSVLAGASMLIYVLLFGGQLTGPIGIQ